MNIRKKQLNPTYQEKCSFFRNFTKKTYFIDEN